MKKKQTENTHCVFSEENIISLELAPGDKISETEIAKELNLSRTPIREAFIELEGG